MWYCIVYLMLYVLVHSLLRNFSFLVSGSSHPMHDDAPCQFYLWSPYITSVFLFLHDLYMFRRIKICSEKSLPVVPETVIVFLAAVAEWRNLLPYCQKFTNLLNTMCLFMKLIMNDYLLCIWMYYFVYIIDFGKISTTYYSCLSLNCSPMINC